MVDQDRRGRSKTRVLDYRREKATDIIRKTTPFVVVWVLTMHVDTVLNHRPDERSWLPPPDFAHAVNDTCDLAKPSSVINPLIYVLAGHRVARAELVRKYPCFGRILDPIYGEALLFDFRGSSSPRSIPGSQIADFICLSVYVHL